MKSFALLCALALAGTFLPACGKKKQAPSAATSASALASAAQPVLAPRVDAALFELLRGLAKKCNVNAGGGNVVCDGGENRTLSADFQGGKRSRAAAVATLAATLADKDPALQTVTANLLNTAFRVPWLPGKDASSVNAEDAKALLGAAVKLPNALARQAVPAAVHAAMLSGSAAEAYALLDKADAAEIRPLGYRYVMTHGRLAALPKVQELAKDPSIALVFAALEAPRNMYDWTDEERAAICPWAAEMLNDSRPNVPSRAAGLLGSCGTPFVDTLLERSEKALKAGKFTAGELGPHRDLCSAAALKTKSAPTEKQCERNRKLLTDVINAKSVDAQTRGLALVSLTYQWPDDKSLKLARALEKNDDKSLAERATSVVKRLELRKAGQAAK
jgi:hypothetical protein